MTISKSDDLTVSELKRLAVDLLSRREHSRLELYRKLSQKPCNESTLQQLLDDLAERDWQSDARFCGSYLRSKSNRGIGPLRLKQELRNKGVSDSIVREQLAALGIDWFLAAEETALKKIKSLRLDRRWREKLYRFLAYRGFAGEHSQHGIDVAECWLDAQEGDRSSLI